MSLAGSSMQVAPSLTAWQSCDGAGSAKNAASTTDCVKIARLMLHSQDSLLTTLLGAGMLRTLGALEGADREYARRLYWWAASAGAMREHFGRYVDDYLATGSEIEATRRLMAAAGTLDPPAGWQPQEWTKASSAKAAATSR